MIEQSHFKTLADSGSASAAEAHEPNEILWDRKNENFDVVLRKMGRYVTSENGFYCNQETGLMVRVMGDRIHHVSSGSNLSTHLSDLIAFKKGHYNAKGFFVSGGYCLIGSTLGRLFLQSFKKYTHLEALEPGRILAPKRSNKTPKYGV